MDNVSSLSDLTDRSEVKTDRLLLAGGLPPNRPAT